MPRRSNRRATEVEEEEALIVSDNDAEMEEEERPTKAASKKKGQGKTTRRDAGSDEEDARHTVPAVDPGYRFDPKSFKDMPLGKPEARGAQQIKLQGMTDDCASILRMIDGKAWGLITDVAGTLSDLAEGDERQKYLDELEDILKDIIEVHTEVGEHSNAIDAIRQRVVMGEEIDNGNEELERLVSEAMQVRSHKTARHKYGKDKRFAAFHGAIWAAQSEEPMPPINTFIRKEKGEESDDEDIAVGGVTQDYKCPLTLKPLEKPMTSSQCGHHYSADAIKEYVKGGIKKCPAAGCRHNITLNVLNEDEDLAKAMKRLEKRRARRAEEEEEQIEVDDDDEEEE